MAQEGQSSWDQRWLGDWAQLEVTPRGSGHGPQASEAKRSSPAHRTDRKLHHPLTFSTLLATSSPATPQMSF